LESDLFSIAFSLVISIGGLLFISSDFDDDDDQDGGGTGSPVWEHAYAGSPS
tara:strand:- start:1164 stop:1319 length:156 start_codon:yes stop_codon:yes gene_type:complete